jgi:hypothetical protein
MPREPSSTGMSDKVWNKVNSPKLEKILLPLKRTTKKSELKLLKDKVKKKVDSIKIFKYFIFIFVLEFRMN